MGPQGPPAPVASLRAKGAPLRGRVPPMDYLDNPTRRSETLRADRTSANSYGFWAAFTRRDATWLDRVLGQLDTWLPIVRRMRPGQPWGDVVRVLNQQPGISWTVERLRRTVRRLAAEGIVEANLLDRARPQIGEDRLIRLVAGIKTAAPDRTLQQIATLLEAMRERTPRGGTRWHRSSVQQLLIKAERLGLNERAS